MTRDTLTGSRIRERRILAGKRQADLAREAGISASYLNLIEHNRRRIGGKLLNDIAQILEVEASLLSEGAEAALIAILREAAADTKGVTPELERIDEFAGRFPGWAGVIAATHRQVLALERTAATLTDRLAHDPHLATSMHEMLTMVTAIRSTAGILAETKELEPEWRNRFHRNLNEDSLRLAESSQALVTYLDKVGDADAALMSPQEEVENFLSAHQFHFEELEQGQSGTRAMVEDQPELVSAASKDMAELALRQYRADAVKMPMSAFAQSVRNIGVEPSQLADAFRVSLAAVFRRLVVMPSDVLPDPVGMVICDKSGTLIFRKEVDGFPLPKFAAACPKWPLFQALTQPMMPVRQVVSQPGREAKAFVCYAVTEPIGRVSFEFAPMLHAYMLIAPAESDTPDVRPVGSDCRICPRPDCAARREPSILVQGI